MADIRIKDLTTTASSTASDDFIAVDGTTNGTRKLNAFSPTFGGNATVTGTLTANGGATVGGGSFAAASFYKSSSLGSVLSGATGSSYDLYITNPAGNYILQVPTGTRNAEFAGTLTTVGNATVGAALTVQATTASTTTSTGALVVGNGTSGGLGVGGAIVAGGTITSTASTDSGLLQLNLVNSSTGTSASSLFRFNAGTRTATLQAYNDTHATLAGQLRVGTSNGDIVLVPSGVATATFSGSGLASFGGSVTSRIDVNGSTSAGLGLRQTGVRDWFISAESNELRVSCLTAASIFAFNSGTPVAMRDSTASTSTSSGALVVSGGVGVAGAINCGSGLVANPLFTKTRNLEAQIPHTVSTEDYLRIGSNTGSTNTYAGEFGYGLTAGGSPQIRFNRVHAGTVTTWLTVPTSTGDAEFAGSVKTAAPSGGTAAAWKLGTVASVSPTSPNRTIEVDIGGTIYYIHAKTTNN